MRSTEENKTSKEDQGPLHLLMETMTQIELITCNISILADKKNGGDKGLESISLDIDLLRKNINECIKLISSTSSQRMDNSNTVQIVKELKHNDINLKPGEMATIHVSGECQNSAPKIPVDKPLKKPMRQNRPKIPLAEIMKNEPKLTKTIPDNKCGRQFGLKEDTIEGQRPITIHSPVVPGANLKVIQPGTGPCKERSPFFNDGPYLIEDCKLPLGKKVIESLDNMGMLVR